MKRLVTCLLFLFSLSYAQDQPLTRKDVEEIAELVTKIAVRKELNAKYRCEVGQYYSDATDRCEQCITLCTPEANAVACSIDCPATYAEVYQISPLRNNVNQLNLTVQALTVSLAALNESYTMEVRLLETTVAELQEKNDQQEIWLIVITAVVVVVLAAAIMVYLFVKDGPPRCTISRGNLSENDAEDVEAGPEPTNNESSESQPVQEESKFKGVPPAQTQQDETYEQGPSGRADETIPLRHDSPSQC